MRRGEIYWADLVPRSGSEQTGRRPVIVVSHDGFNQTVGWRSIIVIPISTSALQGRQGAHSHRNSGGAGGLSKNQLCRVSSGDHTGPRQTHQETRRVAGRGLGRSRTGVEGGDGPELTRPRSEENLSSSTKLSNGVSPSWTRRTFVACQRPTGQLIALGSQLLFINPACSLTHHSNAGIAYYGSDHTGTPARRISAKEVTIENLHEHGFLCLVC